MTISPELQRLFGEPLSEPQARARQHWPALDKRMKKLEEARVQQAGYDAEIARLREEIVLTRARDQEELGKALSAGKPEPEPKAAAIEAEMERNVQRSAAMNDVILKAQRQVAELVLRSKSEWAEDLRRQLTDAAALYHAAIVQLEQAREALTALVQARAPLFGPIQVVATGT